MDTKFFIDTLIVLMQMAQEKGIAISMVGGNHVLVYDEDDFCDLAGALNQEVHMAELEDGYNSTHEMYFDYQGVRFQAFVKREDKQ